MTQGRGRTDEVPSGGVRLVVGVLTFRREAMLAALLPLLESEVDALLAGVPEVVSARVVVVDNAPDRSASTVVELHGGDRTTYCWESVRGISAGRNRALDEAAGEDLLVFIDDDERPTGGWLAALVRTHFDEGASVVAGPVIPEFLDTPEPFVVDGGFFERGHTRSLRTGTDIARAATNNLLLDLRVVRRVGARFDHDFSFSGGEDSLFTGTLTRAGVRAVWCAEAVVVDLVPAERLTEHYVLRRTRALSQSSVLAEIRLRESRRQRVPFRAHVLVKEGARLATGGAQMWRGRISRSPQEVARGRRALARAVGALQGGIGRRPRTYGS